MKFCHFYVIFHYNRVNNKGLKLLGYKSFTEAFSDFAAILDQKPATIKNMRDEFDPYFDNINGKELKNYQNAIETAFQNKYEGFTIKVFKSLKEEDELPAIIINSASIIIVRNSFPVKQEIINGIGEKMHIQAAMMLNFI